MSEFWIIIDSKLLLPVNPTTSAGVIILIFKPFKIGDLIETQGHLGNVKEIQI